MQPIGLHAHQINPKQIPKERNETVSGIPERQTKINGRIGIIAIQSKIHRQMQSPNNTPIRGHLAKKEQAVGLLESRLHSLLRTTFVEAALSVVKLARQHPELIDRELESVLQQYISVQYIYNELRKRGQISRKELWFEKDWLYLTKKDLLRFVGRETREIITNYGIKL